jgi:uncharacterized protein YndB with AHSA1/START domain
VASFSHSVALPRPAEEVFPWLFEEDKVPQWTGNLEAYEVRGAPGQGAHIRQVLTVSGQKVDLDLEITRYDPPHAADSRFSMSGLDVAITYVLEPDGKGSRLTQTLEASASGFKARMLVPMVQPRLEKKLTEDLERLREVLSGA